MTYLSHHPTSPGSHLKTQDFVSCKTKTTKRQESTKLDLLLSQSFHQTHSSEFTCSFTPLQIEGKREDRREK